MSLFHKLKQSRFRQFLLMTGILASGATALASTVPATATNRTYSCGSCSGISGPEDYVYNNEGVDYTRTGAMCTYVTHRNEYIESSACVGAGGYKAIACNSSHSNNNYGHGIVESYPYNDHLAGREDNFTYCG